MTLIETIIYLALFGIIFAAIIDFSLSVAESNQYSQYKNEIEHSAIFLDEHFSASFEKIDQIDNDNTIYDITLGKLRIFNLTDSLDYNVNNYRLKVNRNGIVNFLTNPNIIIDKFLVEKVLSPDSSISGVRITFNILSNKKSSISKQFQTYYSIK